MRTVDLQHLEHHLDEYIRAAEGGEVIAVTNQGRVAAEMVPPRNATETSDEAISNRVPGRLADARGKSIGESLYPITDLPRSMIRTYLSTF